MSSQNQATSQLRPWLEEQRNEAMENARRHLQTLAEAADVFKASVLADRNARQFALEFDELMSKFHGQSDALASRVHELWGKDALEVLAAVHKMIAPLVYPLPSAEEWVGGQWQFGSYRVVLYPENLAVQQFDGSGWKDVSPDLDSLVSHFYEMVHGPFEQSDDTGSAED